MNARNVTVALVLAACSAPLGLRAQEPGSGYPDRSVPGIRLAPVLWQGARDGDLPRKRPAPLPPALRERLKSLPPEERARVLENNRRFQQLTPEQQNALRERLRELKEMPPEQRELMEQRFAIFNNLTPRQQEKARELYEKRWSKLPPARRRALLEQFRKLRAMSPEEREKYWSGSDSANSFSSEERDVLKELMSL